MPAAPLIGFDSSAAPLPDFGRATRFCFLGSGLGFIALGGLVAAHLATAAMPSHLIIGAMMLTGAALHLGKALAMRDADAAKLWFRSGLFYLLGGFAILIGPMIGERALTLALAVMLAISGIGRVVIGIREEAQWVLLSGCASILAGAIIGIDWLQNPLWMIGTVVAFDLTVQGVTLILTGIVHRFPVIGEDDD